MAKAKKSADAMPQALAVAPGDKEVTLGKLAAATIRAGSIASDLSGDARAGEFQAAFWMLSNRVIDVAARFDGAWVRILNRDPPAVADLRALLALAEDAVAKLKLTGELPTTQRCAASLAATATSLDRTDAMIDGVMH